jgi:hypothetical protein
VIRSYCKRELTLPLHSFFQKNGDVSSALMTRLPRVETVLLPSLLIRKKVTFRVPHALAPPHYGVGNEISWNYQLRLPLLAMYDADSLLCCAAFIHVPICHYNVRYSIRLLPTTVRSWWFLSQRYRHWSDYTLCSQIQRHFPLIAGYQWILQRPGSQEPLCAFFSIFA